MGEWNASAQGAGGVAAPTQVRCRATDRRPICGQADIYFFVLERYECGFCIIMIEIYIVFILVHFSVGFGLSE